MRYYSLPVRISDGAIEARASCAVFFRKRRLPVHAGRRVLRSRRRGPSRLRLQNRGALGLDRFQTDAAWVQEDRDQGTAMIS